MQSLVKRENRSGERTHPRGAQVFRIQVLDVMHASQKTGDPLTGEKRHSKGTHI